MFKKLLLFFIIGISCFSASAQTPDYYRVDSLGSRIIKLFEDRQFKEIVRFTDSVFLPNFTAITYEADWTELTGTYGPYLNKKVVYYANPNGYAFISYKINFESLPYILNLGFTPHNTMHYITFIPAHKIYVYPDYVSAEKFKEEEFKSVNGMFELPGTLLTPYKLGKKPLVIIVPDAGPTDRDGSFNENKPYKDLAGGLSSQGYVTYRYEKRSNIYGLILLKEKAAYETYTCRNEYLDDLYKTIDTLKTLPDVDSNQIYLLGHGQGGMLLPLVAKEKPEIKGIMLMGTNAKRMQEMMMDQYDYLITVSPEKKYEYLAQKEKAKKSMSKKLNPLTEHHLMPYDVQATYWIWLNQYPHVAIASKIKQPILVLHGNRDYQVNYDNYLLWKKGLSKKTNVVFYEYPKLNHQFYSGGAASTYSEYFLHSSIPDEPIKNMLDWLSAN